MEAVLFRGKGHRGDPASGSWEGCPGERLTRPGLCMRLRPGRLHFPVVSHLGRQTPPYRQLRRLAV